MDKIIKKTRQNVTVMFTDLKDSTVYFEKHGDIKGKLLIEKHNRILFPVIKKYNGIIIKTIGDAIMARFDKPIDGVKAAIKMQKELKNYNETAIDKIRVRIGLHTGEAIVEDKDVYGDTVNLAARIESKTDPEEITISEDTLKEISEDSGIEVSKQPPVKYKGKSEFVNIYSIRWDPKRAIPKYKEISSKSSKKLFLSILISTIIIGVFGFFIFSKIKKKGKGDIKKVENGIDIDKDRLKIVNYGKKFLNRSIPDDPRWRNNSSGFIKMVFLNFNINLFNVEMKKDGIRWLSSTELIYQFIKENGKIFEKNPKIGDFIFFNNTFDRDKNRKQDDKLTSVGLITHIDKEKTITFLYYYNNKLYQKQINLKYPEKTFEKIKNITKYYNSTLRYRYKNWDEATSAQLFYRFGTILGIDKGDQKSDLEYFAIYKKLPSSKRENVVKFAKKYINRSIPNSNRWSQSSSGFLVMVFNKFKVNIKNSIKKKGSKGWFKSTQLIYQYCKERGKLYKNNPKIGDFIFFNNTFDRDKDGKKDDKLTSIGLVSNIDKNGRVTYLIYLNNKVRKRYFSSIDRIEKKGDIEYNSLLRVGKKGKKLLSFHLFNSYGSIFY